MARVKRAVNAQKKRRTTLERASGYRGQRSRLYRKAKEQVTHSLVYAYRDRKARKGDFRKLWITRINAAARLNDMTYNRFMQGLKLADIDLGELKERMRGKFDYGTGKVVENSPHIMKYWRDFASYPFQSHELWFLTENVRWGKFTGKEDFKALISKVNREDLWRAAATELKVPAAQIPKTTSRGVEKFFDGKTFDPANPAAYLASLAIKRS